MYLELIYKIIIFKENKLHYKQNFISNYIININNNNNKNENPINSLLKDQDVFKYDKKDINECIRNYTKILLGNEFTEAYEMLFRNTKSTKTKKSIKHKTHKRTKTLINLQNYAT